MTINGPGALKGQTLQAKDASVDINGLGIARLKADNTIAAHLVGSGDVIYWGDAKLTNSQIECSGKISKND